MTHHLSLLSGKWLFTEWQAASGKLKNGRTFSCSSVAVFAILRVPGPIFTCHLPLATWSDLLPAGGDLGQGLIEVLGRQGLAMEIHVTQLAEHVEDSLTFVS